MKFLLAFLPLMALFAETHHDIRIPVVDMRDYSNPETRETFLDTLQKAMCDVGFFAVRNTVVYDR